MSGLYGSNANTSDYSGLTEMFTDPVEEEVSTEMLVSMCCCFTGKNAHLTVFFAVFVPIVRAVKSKYIVELSYHVPESLISSYQNSYIPVSSSKIFLMRGIIRFSLHAQGLHFRTIFIQTILTVALKRLGGGHTVVGTS